MTKRIKYSTDMVNIQTTSKELRAKANDFLNSRRNANNLVEIISGLVQGTDKKQPITSTLLTLEVIFVELLKRGELSVEEKKDGPELEYSKWLFERYEESWRTTLKAIETTDRTTDASQAVVTSIKLIAAESRWPINPKTTEISFPKTRLRSVLQKLLSPKRLQTAVIHRFKEFCEYFDVVCNTWKLLPQLFSRESVKNEIFASNYLELMNALAVTKELYKEKKLLCPCSETEAEIFEYEKTRKAINKIWGCLIACIDDLTAPIHKKMLIVLLERVMPHLEKPILLTDFLMDSLNFGGAISLLALQGIFTLIQKHNISYPNIYEKLYSMFEPEIFHTKFKARLFYLADIFLSSTHLPECLVAAFVKRLARLSLVAPPQDAIICIYFIGNLLLRHPGLKRLICAQNAVEVSRDPYIMDEREPTKSNAIESSLWEMMTLQKHSIPTVATAARFINQPLPTTEWDLSTVLEVKEDDIFDQEISKKTKQYTLAFERPQALFMAKNDKLSECWNL